MPRPARLWTRAGRAGWWATIAGKQVCFGDDYDAALAAFHAAKAKRAPAGGARTLVMVAADRYLDAMVHELQPKTMLMYRAAMQHWVNAVGRMRLDALTADHLRRWSRREGWARSTRHTYIGIVKTWAKWCVAEGLLAADPFGPVKRPGIDHREPPPEGALDAILADAPGAFREFLVVLLETGCRPGEIRSLPASRIDWERSTAIVEGKTGRRLIGLTARALEVLRGYAARYPEGPVMRSRTGKPWTESNAKKHMREARLRLGLKAGQVVNYHARHSFWARAVKAGVDSVAIAKQLGHRSLRQLAETYAHADHEIMRETVRRAAGEAVPPPTSAADRKPHPPAPRTPGGTPPRRTPGAGSTGPRA